MTSCTSCNHVAHTSHCVAPGCECGVCRWPGQVDLHDVVARLERVEATLATLAGRVEYLIENVLGDHEACRRVPELVHRVEALEARLAAGSNGAGR